MKLLLYSSNRTHWYLYYVYIQPLLENTLLLFSSASIGRRWNLCKGERKPGKRKCKADWRPPFFLPLHTFYPYYLSFTHQLSEGVSAYQLMYICLHFIPLCIIPGEIYFSAPGRGRAFLSTRVQYARSNSGTRVPGSASLSGRAYQVHADGGRGLVEHEIGGASFLRIFVDESFA